MPEGDVATNGTHAPEEMISISAALRTYAELFRRATMTRAGITFSGRRDLFETLGYKRDLRYEDYYARYKRGGLAKRIIDIFPAATWRLPPIVREKDNPDETQQTPFEAAWDAFALRLGLWQMCARLDRLASLGHYAVLVLGLRGQLEWSQEAQRVRSPEDVLYLNAYSQEHARLRELVNVETSPLFGRPANYRIDFARHTGSSPILDDDLRPLMGGNFGSQVVVHASRVLHVAEDGLEDDIFGTPGLEAVWNYLDDLEKLVGGTSEMTWQDAKRRIVLSLDPTAALSADAATQLTAEVEEFTHELRNFLRVQGMNVTQLEGRVPDASANIATLTDLIAGTKGIPKRRLFGSERGDLASSQDENNWAASVRERQQQFAEPVILRPLIDRLIQLQALPVPSQGYLVEWPSLLITTEKERSEIALNWARTLATYAGSLGSPQEVLPLPIFLEEILEFPQDQAQRIMALLGEALEVDAGELDA